MRLAILGAGAWGAALAQAFAQKGHAIALWSRSDSNALVDRRHIALPDVVFDENVRPTNDLLVAIDGAAAILIATPVSGVRSVARLLAKGLHRSTPIILCAKGVDDDGWFVDEIIAQSVAPACSPMILSGPNFAGEVANGLPTVTVLAGEDAVGDMARRLGTKTLRIYGSRDASGVAACGAAKNVIAIAAGAADGVGFGENARAAIVARGAAEIARLCRARSTSSAPAETAFGLAGVGDLTLTCGPTSRNFRFGQALGRGVAPGAILAEGARACGPLTRRGKQLGVDLPICDAVRRVVEDGVPVHEMVDALLARPAPSGEL